MNTSTAVVCEYMYSCSRSSSSSSGAENSIYAAVVDLVVVAAGQRIKQVTTSVGWEDRLSDRAAQAGSHWATHATRPSRTDYAHSAAERRCTRRRASRGGSFYRGTTLGDLRAAHRGLQEGRWCVAKADTAAARCRLRLCPLREALRSRRHCSKFFSGPSCPLQVTVAPPGFRLLRCAQVLGGSRLWRRTRGLSGALLRLSPRAKHVLKTFANIMPCLSAECSPVRRTMTVQMNAT